MVFDQLCGGVEELSAGKNCLVCYLVPTAPEGSLLEINGYMNGTSLGNSFHCITEGPLVEIRNTIDTFIFVLQVCIYIGVSL